jgi:hypothetical protein
MTEEETDDLLQEAFDYMLEGARDALQRGPSFMPFGAAVRLGGQRLHLNLADDMRAKTAEEQIAGIVAGLQADPGLICASLCFDGAVGLQSGENVPAICMHIEVRGGESIECFTPYVREPTGLTIMQPIIAPTDPEIFVKK